MYSRFNVDIVVLTVWNATGRELVWSSVIVIGGYRYVYMTICKCFFNISISFGGGKLVCKIPLLY